MKPDKMKKNKKDRVFYEHIEHRSGSGEHNNKPKRERTRQAESTKWKKDYGMDE